MHFLICSGLKLNLDDLIQIKSRLQQSMDFLKSFKLSFNGQIKPLKRKATQNNYACLIHDSHLYFWAGLIAAGSH